MFESGQVWETRFMEAVEPTSVYYMIKRLPPQDNGPRFGVSRNTWRVFILESNSVFETEGTTVSRQFDGVSFREVDNGVGWDSYDNMYTRLA